MNGNDHTISSNHVEFVRIPKDKSQNSIINEPNLDSFQQNAMFMHRTISNPTIYETEMDLNSSNSDSDSEEKSCNSKNKKIKAVSSDPNCSLKKQLEIAQICNSDKNYPNLSHIAYKKFASASIPISAKNKLSLQKYRQMAYGLHNGKINRNQFQKFTLSDKNSQIGIGFPSKIPIFNEVANPYEKSEKCYNNLENIIQNMKNENRSLTMVFTSDEKQNENDKNYSNDNNDINYINNNINSTKKQFIAMEINILSDLTDIKSSINRILEERKEIQNQHRIWLANMKKKMYYTKVKKIEFPPTSFYVK